MDGFDYHEFEEYVTNLNIAIDDFQTFLKTFLLEMAQRVVAKAKKRTPVDTGALRNSWTIGNQKIKLIDAGGTTSSGLNKVKIDVNSSQIASIDVVGDYLEVTISNPMEYASYIEFGHHDYPPQYMLTLSIEEVEQQMPRRFNNEFKQFIEDRRIG